MSFRIISLGALSAHPLWNERSDVRTGHATTTLITVAGTNILVNPGLPPAALLARLSERSPIKPDAVSHVFLTSFDIEHTRGVTAFQNATWLIHEPEREAAAGLLRNQLNEAENNDDAEQAGAIGRQIDLLARCAIAEDSIVQGVDLFPLPGWTAGTCGLLLPLPRSTVLVCGDAIPTFEHLEQGKVLPGCSDIETAQESFREAIEIADFLILGRDNWVANPLRR